MTASWENRPTPNRCIRRWVCLSTCWRNQPAGGRAQALHLAAGIYTALTAALLAVMALRRGYSRKSALILALCYGLCTIALPYARTNFREPLAALCLTAGLACVDNLRRENLPAKAMLASLSGMLVCIGLAALTKMICVLCLPFFIAGAWLNLKNRQDPPPRRLVISLTIGLPAILAIGIAVLSSQSGAIHSRFSLAFIMDMFATLMRLPHSHFLGALAGMLVSPGKGLLIYSPILLLSWLRQAQPTRLSPNKRRYSSHKDKMFTTNTRDALIAFGSLAALMAVQALVYDRDWWNITWGTRALLPALPLLMIVCLPALDAGLNHNKRRIRITVWSLIIFSFLIQAGRLLTSDPAYVGWLVQATGEEVNSGHWWSIRLMPLWRHWQMALKSMPSDIAWLHLDLSARTYVLLPVGASLLIIVSSALLLLRKKSIRQWIIVLLLLLTLALMPISLAAAGADTRYYGQVEEYRQACQWTAENTAKDSPVLVDAYLKPLWWYSFNFGCAGGEWIGLPYEHTKAFSSDLFYPRLRELAQWIEEKQSLGMDTYLLETGSPGSPAYPLEIQKYGLEAASCVEDITGGKVRIFRISSN